jgi:hypothetical protein
LHGIQLGREAAVDVGRDHVFGVAPAHVDAGPAGGVARVVPGILQRAPRRLQEQPVLGVQHRRLRAVEAEQLGLEAVRFGKVTLGRHVVGAAQLIGVDTRGEQFVLGEVGD